MTKSVVKEQSSNETVKEKKLGGCTGKGWMPGQSGNPNGRPRKERSVTDIIRQMLNEGHNGKDIAKLLAEQAVKFAATGSHPYFKEIMDRTEGKVPDKVIGDGKIEVTVNFVKEPITYARDRDN